MLTKNFIKNAIKKLVSPVCLGYLDYYRFPERRESWGGPLNGQIARQKIFAEMFQAFQFQTAVETGTFRGTSTKFIANLGAKRVFTVEAEKRSYGFAVANLRSQLNVVPLLGDSRALLNGYLREEINSSEFVFFYLDAHWGADLPLVEELSIIFEQWTNAIVCIDDFRVPDDPGYGYDNYGLGCSLELTEILPITQQHSLAIFFPSFHSSDETGARRGSVVLAKNASSIYKLGQMVTLRVFSSPSPC
jgi:hypothetical protein